MVSFKSLLTATCAFSSAVIGQQFKIQNWGNGEDTTNYTYKSLQGGRFTLDWVLGAGGNFVAGKGYSGSPNLVVNYTAKYNPTGNSYMALYGFSQNPFVEFYVMEAFAEHNPSDNTGQSFYGYHTSDGAQYELWSKYNGNLRQYWSVRRTNRRGGTITFNNHYNAWINAGLPLGQLQNTFIVVEGQQGTGNADITVGVRPTGSIVETPTPTTRTAVCMASPTIGPVCKKGQAKRDGLTKVARNPAAEAQNPTATFTDNPTATNAPNKFAARTAEAEPMPIDVLEGMKVKRIAEAEAIPTPAAAEELDARADKTRKPGKPGKSPSKCGANPTKNPSKNCPVN